MITVFTPTYNRAYIIGQLYESLCHQSKLDFEWLVVDDGSTDNTEHLIASFIEQKRVKIRYIKQANGGKHRAINHGVKVACGELFFIVDSDDRLMPDAIKWIEQESGYITDKRFAGLSGIRIYPDGKKIGGGTDFGIIETDAIAIRRKYHIGGDLAEVYKTEVLRQFPFPDIPNERFCSEGLVWQRIAAHYNLRYVYKGIYVCDYLQDGLTNNSVRLRLASPGYSALLYSEYAHNKQFSLKQRMKFRVNFWVYTRNLQSSFFERLKMIGLLNIVFYPLGQLYYLWLKKNHRT